MKKVFPLIILSILINFEIYSDNTPIQSHNQPQDLIFTKNHLTSQDFPSEDVKNITIKTTYETLEFSEIYGTDISIDVYSNNNTILPEIKLENNTITIKSSVITKSKKATLGDICKIIIYLPKDIWLNSLSILYAPELFSQETEHPQKNEEFIIPAIKSLNTTIETINTSITGKNITGNIVLKTKNGNIKLENITPKQVSKTKTTTKEDIQLYATTNSGTITISNFTGSYLSLKSGNNITARNIAPEIFEIKSLEGNIVATIKNSPLATSEIRTKSGNIQIFMPKNNSYTINVTSLRGTFIDKIDPQRKTRPHTITKNYNNGGPSINLETLTGTIELESF